MYYLQQRADDASSVYGVSGVNAFHILYDTMYRFRDEDDEKPQNPNTFSLSIYEDASIRVRYHKIETTITTTDTFGMWGSRSSSSEKSNLYYHNEMLSSTSVSEGLDYVYCSSNVLACPVRSCVSEGETLNMYWTGTINCAALGNDIMRSYECAWAGGLAVTDGFVDTFDGRQTLSCRVPQLRNISDGELMTVEITTKFILTPSAEKKYNISIVNNNIPAQKSVYALTDMISMTEGSIDEYGDLTKHSVMIRYYSAGSSISLNEFCGCSPLSGHNYSSDNSVCDLCGVCRSAATEQHPRSIDCNGDCFGRAYVDDCGNCSAGSTMIEPDNTCNNALYQDKTYDENLIGQLIFIMVVVCFMSCVFSVCVYFSRTIFTNDHQVAGMDFIFVEQTQIPVFTNRSVVRGLSAFERDALGTVKYDPRASHSEECAICLLSLEPGDICRVLPEPCGHCFHVDCVDKWFQVSPACPLCKRSIKKILLGEPEFMSPINFDFSNFGSAPEPIPSPMVRNNDSEDAVGSIDSAHSGIELVVSSRSRDGAYDRV